MARERIAIVTTSYPTSPGDAGGHFVQTEARMLAGAGARVTVIAPGAHFLVNEEACEPGPSSNAPAPNAPPLRIVRLPDGGASGWPGLLARLRQDPRRAAGLARWTLAAARALRRMGPFERVIAHWLLPAALPVALAAGRGARLEVVVHGSDARLLARFPRPLARRCLSALLARDAEFRCVSNELAELVRRLAAPHATVRMRVAPLPIDVSRAPKRAQARAALGIARSERLVVIVGRLVPDKRVDVALGAARLLPNTTTVVVGDGPERAWLAERFGAARFVGQVDRDVALTWIAAADVVLSASRYEGAPTVVREARALGVAVVAANAGDLAHWAENDAGVSVVL